MRLTSATLHPFGHFTEQSFDLSQPLVVIHGPNELGKTTLQQAIFHALFTPTKLTEAGLRDTVRPWLPLPDGDYAQVTLTFVRGDTTWKLVKRWGAGQSSELNDGNASLGDPARVQVKLDEMLAHGKATYRHVLFTGQAELEHTLATIKAKAGDLRDVRDLLKAASGAAADVDEQKLRRLLEQRIKEMFGRWEENTGRPERQGGKERGVGNEWEKGAGSIVKTWYAWQTDEVERTRVLAIEKDLDRVAAEASGIEEKIRLANEFVRRFGGLRDALIQRQLHEAKLAGLEQKVAELNTAFIGWPRAEAGVNTWNQRKQELGTEHERLVKERETAEGKRAGTTTAAAFEKISMAKQSWEDAQADSEKHPDPGVEQVKELERLETAINAGQNKLASRKLLWQVDTDTPGNVMVERGMEPAETIATGPEGLAGIAEARIRVVAAGIRLSVESGGDDVEALFRALSDDRASLGRLLDSCGATSVAEVKAMAEMHRKAVAVAENKKQIYESLLTGKTFEQWVGEVAGIRDLPDTREMSVIDEELRNNRERLAEGNAVAKQHGESIEEWKRQFTTYEMLTEKLLEGRGVLKEAKDLLEKLPTLPEQFESTDRFLESLDTAQLTRLEGEQNLSLKKQEQVRLTTELADRRSEDLGEKAEAAKRTFERTRTKGRDYLRIREVLDTFATLEENDPMVEFGEKVAAMFSRITGQPTTLAFDGQLPASVERGGVQVPQDRLSQGANGALALALRLAMTQAYLAAGSGFIMLDDPLVNLDKHRMAQAAEIIRRFSEQAQLIFFTCHDEHAARLKQLA